MPLTRPTSGLINTTINAVGATNLIDCSLGTYFTKTIAANTTFSVANVPSDRTYAFTLELIVTSGTVTWWNGLVWPTGNAPSLVNNFSSLFMFITDNGGVTWRGSYLTNYASVV